MTGDEDGLSPASKALACRFRSQQQNRILIHPSLPQPQLSSSEDAVATEQQISRSKHCFVVCADTQLGMTSKCQEWETELEYSRKAVQLINSLQPRPLFCTMCGDISDMEYTFYCDKAPSYWTREQCDRMQDQQYEDFQKVYDELHPDIPLICICGNHDIGNRPTKASIARFANYFGDDYFAFWVNGTYNIVLNTTLISDHSAPGAQELYDRQLQWLQERLQYANISNSTPNSSIASNIFVFGHHPWFLYHEDEKDEDMPGESPYPKGWGPAGSSGVPDSYFTIPRHERKIFLKLFQEYGVTAYFCGHFHQNMVSKTSFGMDMIITSSLSMVFESTGKPKSFVEPSCRGVRLVQVEAGPPSSRGSGSTEANLKGGDGNQQGETNQKQQGNMTHVFLPL